MSSEETLGLGPSVAPQSVLVKNELMSISDEAEAPLRLLSV